jgi:PAS domain S-box-containing protein
MSNNTRERVDGDVVSSTSGLVDDLLDAIPVGVIVLDPELSISRVNAAARTILNLTGDLLGHSLAHLAEALGDPDLVTNAKATWESQPPTEHEIEMPNGRWYRAQLQPAPDAGRPALVLTLTPMPHPATAVGDRVPSRQPASGPELADHHDAYRDMVEHSPDLIARFDRELRHLYVNPAVERLTGRSAEAYIGRTNEELGYAPELVEKWNRELRRVFETGKVNTLEFSYTDTEGASCHLHSQLVPEFDAEDEVASVISVVRDLTHFEETVAALTASDVKYRTLFNGARNPIIIFDRHVNILLINPAAAEVFNRDVDDLTGKPLNEIAPRYSGLLQCRIDRVLETGETVQSIDSPTLSAGERWYLTITQPITGVPAWGDAVQLIAYDMTLRVRAEKALEKSRAQLERILEHLPAGVVHVDHDQLWINRTVEEITGYTQQELESPEAWFKTLYPEQGEQRLAEHARYRTVGFPEPVILRVTRKDGTHRWVQFRGFTLEDGEEITVMHDITAQREAAEALEAALHEKETLLRELYHRTKNNMQVISAILALQSDRVEDPTAIAAIKETQARIRSIALVHEKLYESENLSKIDLGAYVMDLVNLLFQTYGSAPAGRVIPRLELQSVPVVVDIAIPCGLILNELIANSLQHGFPDGQPGELRVTLAETETEDILVTVADNGVGLPEDLDVRESKTLGLQSVLGIVEHQLRGTVDFETAPGQGVICRITFPRDRYVSRV